MRSRPYLESLPATTPTPMKFYHVLDTYHATVRQDYVDILAAHDEARRLMQEYPAYGPLTVGIQGEVPSTKYVTSAPADYDWMGTREVEVTCLDERIVDVRDEYAPGQLARYRSGRYYVVPYVG